MSDGFLDLAKNKTIKKALKKIGIRLPQTLVRDLGIYRSDMFIIF